METRALLGFEELLDDTVLRAYAILGHAMLFCTLVVVGFTTWIVWKASTKSMARYRIYLLVEIAWSLVLDLIVGTVCPVSTLPVPCFFSAGLLRHAPTALTVLAFFVGVMAAVGKALGLFFLFLHRIAQSMPPQSRLSFIRELRQHPIEVIFVPLFSILYVMLSIFVLGPIAFAFPNQMKQRELLSSESPVFAQLYASFPSLTCFGSDPRLHELFSAAFMLGICPFLVLAGIALMFYFTREHDSRSSRRIQLMFVRSLSAQLLTVTLTLILPALAVVVAPLLQFRHNPSTSAACFALLMAHTPMDCVMILAFIKPYRSAISSIFGKSNRRRSSIAIRNRDFAA